MRHFDAVEFSRWSVSIHASVKDATISSGLDFRLINVSIHASVKDATIINRITAPDSGFNPRICKRCDHA